MISLGNTGLQLAQKCPEHRRVWLTEGPLYIKNYFVCFLWFIILHINQMNTILTPRNAHQHFDVVLLQSSLQHVPATCIAISRKLVWQYMCVALTVKQIGVFDGKCHAHILPY